MAVSTAHVDEKMKDMEIKDEGPDDAMEVDDEGFAEAVTSAMKKDSDEVHNLEVLKLVKEAQQARGLRHGDYIRYRQYCTRKLHRLRKSLSFPQGTKTRFHGKTLKAEHVTNARYLQIPLFIAERAWSYGMQLKQESGADPRKKFLMVRKFSRAALWAKQLSKLSESVGVDARTKLETEAYDEWMRGVFFFNKELWKDALESFSHSKAIYESIALTLDEETRILYRQRIDETVPQIRFCGYNIGDQSAVEDLIRMRLKPGSAAMGEGVMAKLDELIAQSREKQSENEISWLGRTVPVKNPKIRGLLISAQEGMKQLEAAEVADVKLEILENSLNILREALQLVQEELKTTTKEQQTSGHLTGSQLLHSYITFLKNRLSSDRAILTIRIMKNEIKLSPEKEAEERKKKHKPQDFIRLYDTVVENSSETAELAGVAGTVLLESVNAEAVLNKAYRALYIANAFVGVKKFPEAFTFFTRASDFGAQAKKAYTKLEKNEVITSQLDKLDDLVNSQKDAALAFSILQKEEFVEVESEILARHRKVLGNELDLPTAKPFTFDLVQDAIKLPSLDEYLSGKKLKQKVQNALASDSSGSGGPAESKQTAAGIGSALKGWIGWGSKKS